MNHLQWSRTPQLARPVIVAAFEGWNDAGDAATTAVRHLRDRLRARPFAELEPEEFFDFTSTRPVVEITGGRTRRVNWPRTELAAADAAGPADVITLVGIEPQLKWRTFCDELVTVARATNARLVLTLGALLAEVAHTRPTTVFGTSYDDDIADSLGLQPSSYEGPTGIVGVLHAACIEAGIPSASLWAGVPSYVPGAPSPKAALALVQRLVDLLNIAVPVTDLEIAAAAYERQVTRLVSEDEETAAYVEQLETHYDDGDEDELDDDDEELDAESLVEEVEQFLRNQEQ
jgi:predicted ATP-grasp superfamily ATP-dependent carboligase